MPVPVDSPRAAEGIRDPPTLHKRCSDACNASDLDALLSLNKPDAVIVERTGELTTGTDAISDHIAQLPRDDLYFDRADMLGQLGLA